jgi:hypothetical protein
MIETGQGFNYEEEFNIAENNSMDLQNPLTKKRKHFANPK